jgi:hypothetical protein
MQKDCISVTFWKKVLDRKTDGCCLVLGQEEAFTAEWWEDILGWWKGFISWLLWW